MDVLPEAKFIQARHYAEGPRAKGKIRNLVIHTMEAPEKGSTAEAVANYFATTKTVASAHWCVDNDSEVRCVHDDDIAYHAPGLSHRSIGLEHAGYARQTAADWADEYSQRMLKRSAQLAATYCHAYDIPPVFVNAAGLLRGEAGITTHAEVTKAWPDKGHGHWDPGPWFPMAGYLVAVEQSMAALLPKPGRVDHNLSIRPYMLDAPVIEPADAAAWFCKRRTEGANGYSSADVRTIVNAYWATARLTGIPLAVFIAQLAHETGYLTSEWSAKPRCNPAGIGVIGGVNGRIEGVKERPPVISLPVNHSWQWVRNGWESGVAFGRWAPDAVDAHVGRLTAYVVPAGAESHEQARLIDIAGRWRTIPMSVRGSAGTLLQLGQAYNPKGVGWAKPGHDKKLTPDAALAQGETYGHKLAEKINQMLGAG